MASTPKNWPYYHWLIALLVALIALANLLIQILAQSAPRVSYQTNLAVTSPWIDQFVKALNDYKPNEEPYNPNVNVNLIVNDRNRVQVVNETYTLPMRGGRTYFFATTLEHANVSVYVSKPSAKTFGKAIIMLRRSDDPECLLIREGSERGTVIRSNSKVEFGLWWGRATHHASSLFYRPNIETIPIACPAIVQNGRLMLPIRSMAFALGADPKFIRWKYRSSTRRSVVTIHSDLTQGQIGEVHDPPQQEWEPDDWLIALAP